ISHPKDISLHIPSFLLYNQMGKAVFLCLRSSFVNFQLILQSKLLGCANDEVSLFAGKTIGVLNIREIQYAHGKSDFIGSQYQLRKLEATMHRSML
ncbi:MAG: hypothetical protein ACI3V2_09840, partial [Faecousia sp.]